MDAMNTDTRELLAELRQDHRNMARVLDLMDDIVTEMEAGKDPDFELFDEAMRYMTVYPDAIHHPREDLVYTAMREHCADLAEGLGHVPDEHREIAELGATLRKDVEAIISGAALLNALDVVGKDVGKVKVVFSGAAAAGGHRARVLGAVLAVFPAPLEPRCACGARGLGSGPPVVPRGFDRSERCAAHGLQLANRRAGVARDRRAADLGRRGRCSPRL